MTDEERAYYVERCLRLEAELARALGLSEEVLLPQIERRDLYEALPAFHITFRNEPVRTAQKPMHHHAIRIQRSPTDDEKAKMRELRGERLSYEKIGARLQFSPSTVRVYASDVEIRRTHHGEE